MKRFRKHPFFIRLMHWEYWNSRIVYAPLYPYWLWLSLKARSFFFLVAANPSIRNGGFIMESKMDIYNQLPRHLYPRTLLFESGTPFEVVRKSFADSAFSYPIIAKPDYGERGLAVKKIEGEYELSDYVERMPVGYLIQEYISYPLEAGFFFIRHPGERRGRITGIVNKFPVAVTGDGVQSFRQLIDADDRYRLQWNYLQRAYGERMEEVPVKGEAIVLIPYGNHVRGSKFADETHRLSPVLEEALLNICNQVPDFHFGRLDIRFESWELLASGNAFSVIEVNGSGSEPTHIYDPRHSIFFAWREIIRHWRWLYTICKARHKDGVPYLSLKEGLAEIRAFKAIEALLAAQYW